VDKNRLLDFVDDLENQFTAGILSQDEVEYRLKGANDLIQIIYNEEIENDPEWSWLESFIEDHLVEFQSLISAHQLRVEDRKSYDEKELKEIIYQNEKTIDIQSRLIEMMRVEYGVQDSLPDGIDYRFNFYKEQ
jgi:hypothetical protein